MLYRLHFRDEWDPNEPRGVLISFHGNSTGTQRDMLGRGRGTSEVILTQLGLAHAVVGSPGSNRGGRLVVGYLPGIGGRRAWEDPDQRLVHELLQSGFDSQFAVDYNRIVFASGSQGTGFIARFFERYAGIYGGGFHARCGDFWAVRPNLPPRYASDGSWEPSFPWNPFTASMVKDRFRVFVEMTTGDFLYEDALAMRDYYGDVLALDTRFDLDDAGGHCARSSTPRTEIWEWLSRGGEGNLPSFVTTQDADGDGLSNANDRDDDNDGAWDSIDALPLDPRGHLDTDGDGVGNFEDRDADGDGVSNTEDPFPLDSREWMDADTDGIGDNIDADDDNDGLPDDVDPDPLRGLATDQLAFRRVVSGVCCWTGITSVHARKPLAFVYPEPLGNRQSYQYLELGNGPDRAFQILIDRLERNETCRAVLLPELCEEPPSPFAFFEHYVDRIYVDTNQNGDLTDDGPPLLLGRNRQDRRSAPRVGTVVNLTYRSGETLPYGLILWTTEDLDEGTGYQGGSVWMGRVRPPAGEPVLVAAADWNLDGLFNSDGPRASRSSSDPRDFVCVDVNRNGALDECVDTSVRGHYGPEDSVKFGDTFTLDRRMYRLVVAPTGHKVEIVSAP